MSKLRSDELVNMEGDGSPNFPQGATSIEPTANNQVATKSYVDSTISAGLGNVVSSTAPTNPVFGSFWTDTSVAPRVLKTWDGTAWVEFDGTTAGISGLIRPPVEVLTPLNGAGITEFTQYEPLSSTITAVGEAGTIAKNTDDILSVVDVSTGAVVFDGSDILTVPSLTTAPQGTNDWTIEFYAYFDSWSGNRVVTWADDTSHPNYRIAVQVESGKYYIVDGANYGSSWYSSKNDLASYTSIVAPLNKWHHVAVQRASGVDTIYVDGQVQFTASGHTASSSSVTGNWTIGGGQAGHTHLIGKLSNFRVLNGTAQYSSTFTPPTTPLTNITNTVLLCCQSGSSVTAATVSPGTLTATGDPTATTANVTGNKTLSFPTNTNFSGLSVGNVVQREYATWDSTTEGGVQSSTFSNNNQTVVTSNISATHVKSSVTLPTSGKWYAELTVNSYNYLMYGVIAASNDTNYPGYLHQKTESYLHYANYADTYRGTNSGTETGTIPIVNAGDVVGILLDLDNQELRFSINGTVHGGYNSVTNTVPLTVAVSDVDTSGTAGVTLNAGQSPWVHEPPSGYLGVSVAATITAIDAAATPPTVTVDGGTWDSSNQSQVWSNGITSSTGGFYSGESADKMFDGSLSNMSNTSSGGGASLTFTPPSSLTYASSVEIYTAGVGTHTFNGGASSSHSAYTWTTVASGSGTVNSIVVTGGNYPAWVAIRVDGKLLIDAVNDSRVWSSEMDAYQGNSAYVFDGNIATYAEGVNTGDPIIWTPSGGVPYTSSVEVYTESYSVNGRTAGFTFNGGSLIETPVVGWYTLATGSGVINEIRHGYTSDYRGGIGVIKVDGKLLVDAGVRDFGDRKISSSISYEKSLTFTDDTELANMVTPLEMVDANGDVVTPVSDTIANVSNNVLTLQGNTNLQYFQPGDEVQTGVEIVSVDQNAPSITVDGGEWLGADGTNSAKRISRSLRFNSADSAYLSRTPTSAGNRKTWTWSGWVKRSLLSSYRCIFSNLLNNSNGLAVRFDVSDKISIEDISLSGGASLTTTRVFRDISAWYHIVIAFDTTQSTASNRVKLWVNGVQETLTGTQPNESIEGQWNQASRIHYIARQTNNYGYHLSGYLADVHFVDGQALAPTEFGELDDNNVWQAKQFAGTYNDSGQVFSNTLTTDDPSGFPAAYPASLVFNGTLSSNTFVNGQSSTITWDASSYGITIGSQIKVGIYNSYNLTVTTSTGSENLSGAIGATHGFVTFTVTGTLQSITSFGAGSFAPNLSAVEVDGVHLTDTPAGVNGFHLDFSDNSSNAALGYDAAGSNDWTVNNLSVASGAANDSLVDVPANHGDDTGAGGEVRGNYCTINPLGVSNNTPTISDGNLQMVLGAFQATRLGTIGVTSGKWYWEIVYTAATAFDGMVGVARQAHTLNSYVGVSPDSWGYYYTGVKYHAAGSTSYGDSWTTGDVMGVALDMDNLALYFSKNGVWQNSGVPTSGASKTGAAYTNLSGEIFPALNAYGGTQVANWGQRPWAYPAPSGYKALCDTNLPSATIKDGSKHFDVVTYTGNGSTQTISGLEFSPDLVWIKRRSGSASHVLNDTVRGAGKQLRPDLTDAEATNTNNFAAFTSDGFTVGTGSGTNASSQTHVAWAWNAGDNSNKTYAVTVVSDSGNKYRFDGHGTSAVTLDLEEGSTYTFDQSDSSNAGHPLRFSTTSNGTHGGGTEYTTGVTTTGTPGSAGASTTIVVASGAPTLYYYCSVHSGMGGQVNTNSTAGATVLSGSLNSSTYDQSAVFSNNVTSTSGSFYSGRGPTNLFDGSTTTLCDPANQSGVLTFTPSSAISYLSSVEVYVSTGCSLSLNGGTSITSVTGWNTIATGSGSVTSIAVSISGFRPNWAAVRIDGKLLVDSGVSVTNVPSINSVVRANPAAGFSIVSYTGTGSNGTIGHGLNAAPQLILTKNRTTSGIDWIVYHPTLDSGKVVLLNSTLAQFAPSGGTYGTISSSTYGVTIGSNFGNLNATGDNYVAYCFAPVKGYSAIGSYTGNGSADGPFVFTNFRPAFVVIKGTWGGSWRIYDTKRDTGNVTGNKLYPNQAVAENGSSGDAFSYNTIDMLSNGFKLRSSSSETNYSANTFIYMAFAENPVAQDAQTVTTGDTQVALDALVAAATEIVETDGTTMYLNSATGPWRTGLSIEGSQINAAPPGPSEVTFTTMNNGTTPVSMIDATLSTRTWTLESSTTSTGPWTSIDTYTDFDATDSQDGATPWTTTRPTLQPNTYYRVKVAYNSTNADSVESVYSTFKTGDA